MRNKKSGFARTKTYPHKRHPANYRKKDNDLIEYVTFTHSDEVLIGNQKIKTKSLSKNIDKRKQGEGVSKVLPIVFEGKRSSLGKEEKLYLSKEDFLIVEEIFKSSPHKKVPITKNSKQKK